MSIVESTETGRKRLNLLEALERLAGLEREPRVRLALAEAEFRLAIAPETEPPEAIARLRAAISHDPFLPKLFLHLGRLLHRSGRHRAAVSEYRRAVQLAPSSRRAHQLLALALLELDRPDQEIGQALIAALSHGSREELRAAIADLDARLAEQHTADSKKPDSTRKARRPGGNGSPAGDADTSRWPDTWRVALVEQLSRSKPVRARVDAHLDTGIDQLANGGGIAEYACACMLMVVSGDPPGEVRRLMARSGVDGHADKPAVVMLEATLGLAETGDPAAFVEAATRHLRHGVLVPELVCWLHYVTCGPMAGLTLAEAVGLLNTYPESIQDLDCFRELRLAVLDDYARKAWAGERFDEAKLLWRETIPLDAYRVPVAINLALLAARTRSTEEYQPAWDRVAELLYLHPAGAGDVQLFLDERRALHLALTQQSRQRHCAANPAGAMPSEEELSNWLADPDALETWLREWDLYYLNARLHFRSPTQLLGVPRDASTEELAAARDALIEHIDVVLRGHDWAGLGVFRDLASNEVHEAFRRAADPVDRARDPYHELEEPGAEALAGELVQRALLLRRMLALLAERKAARHIPLGCSIARRQFILPGVTLQRLCLDRGLIDHETELRQVFETDLVHLAAQWNEPEPAGEREWSRRLAALDDCVAVLPQRLDLRTLRCRLLREAGRHAEAYAAALAALELPMPPKPDDAESAQELRTGLIHLIDDVGYLELPETARQPRDVPSAESAVAVARQTLRRFPHSGTLRRFLANLLVQLGGEARMREAIELLTAGLDSALGDEQRRDFEEQLTETQGAAAKDVIRQQVKKLAEPAITRVREAVEGLAATSDSGARQATLRIVRQAITDVSEAIDMARRAELSEEVGQLAGTLTQLRAAEQQLQSGEG